MILWISFSGCRWPVPMPIDKSIQALVSFWEVLSYPSIGQTRSILNPLLYSHIVPEHRIRDQ